MRTKPFKMALLTAVVMMATLACSLLSSVPSSPSSVPALPTSSNSGGSNNGGTGGNGNTTGDILLKDDFSDSSSGWGIADDANKVVQYSNGMFEFKVIKANDLVYSTPSDTAYENVHIEVTVKPNTSDPNTAFGILCDQQVTNDSFYYFAVTSNGQYAIVKAALAKDDVFLTNGNDWATSKLIPENADSYTLGADCGNGTLTFYVNGKQIDSVTDSAYAKGKVGLFAWSDKKTNSVDVTFDNFVMTSLK